jgi:hypothetical protein
MIITTAKGTVATYPSQYKMKYYIQFTLQGGRSYRYKNILFYEDAEKKCCEVALSHPTWKDMEESENWLPL